MKTKVLIVTVPEGADFDRACSTMTLLYGIRTISENDVPEGTVFSDFVNKNAVYNDPRVAGVKIIGVAPIRDRLKQRGFAVSDDAVDEVKSRLRDYLANTDDFWETIDCIMDEMESEGLL